MRRITSHRSNVIKITESYMHITHITFNTIAFFIFLFIFRASEKNFSEQNDNERTRLSWRSKNSHFKWFFPRFVVVVVDLLRSSSFISILISSIFIASILCFWVFVNAQFALWFVYVSENPKKGQNNAQENGKPKSLTFMRCSIQQ